MAAPTDVRQVWAGLPEVNRQAAVGRLVRLASRVMAVVTADPERGGRWSR
jgi:hypothetical protein